MRRSATNLLLGLLFSSFAFISSCVPTTEFPVVPKIEFSNVYFVDSNTDSLVITLQFQDGDGDLGLSSDQNNYPFHQYNYYSRENGEELNAKAHRLNQPVSINEAIHYSDKRTGEIDSLPPYAPPYTCTRWRTEPFINGTQYPDTLYYQRNPNHYNIFVTFLLRDPNTEFEEFDWDQIGCGVNYHGRFPIMVEDNKEKAIEGSLTYKIQGVVLGNILDRKIIKLRIYIQDRALNKSMPVESQEFILSEITK